MITLKNEAVKEIINLPTDVKELTPDVFNKLTKHIILQKHYVVVAICWNLTLGEILMTNKKNGEAKVITMIAKTNVEEKDSWVSVGDIAIMNRSAIEMGTHVYVPTVASVSSISSYFNKLNSSNNKKVIPMNIIQTLPKEHIYIMEFKIVPVSDIKATCNVNANNEDPFNGTV